jgi:hypothetical protein
MVVVAIPRHETFYTLFNAGIGFITDIIDQCLNVGKGIGDITGL